MKVLRLLILGLVLLALSAASVKAADAQEPDGLQGGSCAQCVSQAIIETIAILDNQAAVSAKEGSLSDQDTPETVVIRDSQHTVSVKYGKDSVLIKDTGVVTGVAFMAAYMRLFGQEGAVVFNATMPSGARLPLKLVCTMSFSGCWVYFNWLINEDSLPQPSFTIDHHSFWPATPTREIFHQHFAYLGGRQRPSYTLRLPKELRPRQSN